jgi:predicted permease
MRLIAEWGRRVWFLLHRRRFEDELHQEMESHRAMMDDPRRFGNARRLREDAVDVWGWQWLDHLGRDTRFAARTLVRSPGFAAMAILSLALATGATTAIFSVINGVLLRPLPFHEPDRLVQIFGSEWRQDRGVATDNMSAPIGREEIDAYRRSPQIAAMAAYGLSTAHLIGAGRLERLTSVETDLAFFDVLGVPALVGRVFTPADGPDVVVVSAGWWARQFGSDPTVAGRVVILNGRSVTILGVMPPSFQFPYGAGSVLPTALPEMRTDVWLPFPLRDATGAPRRRGRTHVIARLAPSSSVASLQTELGGMAEQVQRGFQDPRIRIKVRVAPLKEVVAGPVRQSLWMLFAAVGLVLAAACANLANLLLARLSVRAREVVTRAALGATPRRLVSQFLVESVLLSVLGGAAGAPDGGRRSWLRWRRRESRARTKSRSTGRRLPSCRRCVSARRWSSASHPHWRRRVSTSTGSPVSRVDTRPAPAVMAVCGTRW